MKSPCLSGSLLFLGGLRTLWISGGNRLWGYKNYPCSPSTHHDPGLCCHFIQPWSRHICVSHSCPQVLPHWVPLPHLSWTIVILTTEHDKIHCCKELGGYVRDFWSLDSLFVLLFCLTFSFLSYCCSLLLCSLKRQASHCQNFRKDNKNLSQTKLPTCDQEGTTLNILKCCGSFLRDSLSCLGVVVHTWASAQVCKPSRKIVSLA